MAKSARFANYLQVHFSQSEKEALRIEAFNRRTDMKTIVRQAVSEFLARLSAEAGDSSVSLSAMDKARRKTVTVGAGKTTTVGIGVD